MPDFEVIMRNSLVRTSKGPIFHATKDVHEMAKSCIC